MSHSLWAGKQEEDKIQVGPAFKVVGITIVIIIATYECVHHYTSAWIAGGPPRVSMSESRKISINTNGEPLTTASIPQFGMLHQTLFDTVSDARDIRALADERLETYGWVDEQKSVAHIPIDRAMEMVIKQHGGK